MLYRGFHKSGTWNNTSVVDTSIYIEDGDIKEVFETKMTVKVPSGMKEADLARPVIEIVILKLESLKMKSTPTVSRQL